MTNNDVIKEMKSETDAYNKLPLTHFDKKFSYEPDVVIASCNYGLHGSENLAFAGMNLLTSKDFALRLVKSGCQYGLIYFSNALRDDEDVVTAFIDGWGRGDEVKWASDRLKASEKIMACAVKNNGNALEFASDALKDNPAMVKLAVKMNCESISYASERLRNDRAFILDLVTTTHIAFSFLKDLPECYRSDREIVMNILKEDHKSFEFVDSELRNDTEVAWQAMISSGLLAAPRVFQYAGPAVQKDADFVERVLAVVKEFKPFGRKELIANIKEIHKTASRQST